MTNEYYGAPSTPTSDYLAHYGVKGMKWGVRKAIQTGGTRGERRLSRQFAKAQKKLAKLEKRAAKSDTYAKRAKRMAAGAAVAGGLAAAGTSGVAAGMKGVGGAMANVGRAAGNLALRIPGKGKIKNAAVAASKGFRNAGNAVRGASGAVENWGKATGAKLPVKGLENQLKAGGRRVQLYKGVSNNALARIGAGAIGAGLAAGAAKNAYRAKTAQKKAAQFRTEMNKAFAGTKYANGGNAQTQTTISRKKKRRG